MRVVSVLLFFVYLVFGECCKVYACPGFCCLKNKGTGTKTSSQIKSGNSDTSGTNFFGVNSGQYKENLYNNGINNDNNEINNNNNEINNNNNEINNNNNENNNGVKNFSKTEEIILKNENHKRGRENEVFNFIEIEENFSGGQRKVWDIMLSPKKDDKNQKPSSGNISENNFKKSRSTDNLNKNENFEEIGSKKSKEKLQKLPNPEVLKGKLQKLFILKEKNLKNKEKNFFEFWQKSTVSGEFNNNNNTINNEIKKKNNVENDVENENSGSINENKKNENIIGNIEPKENYINNNIEDKPILDKKKNLNNSEEENDNNDNNINENNEDNKFKNDIFQKSLVENLEEHKEKIINLNENNYNNKNNDNNINKINFDNNGNNEKIENNSAVVENDLLLKSDFVSVEKKQDGKNLEGGFVVWKNISGKTLDLEFFINNNENNDEYFLHWGFKNNKSADWFRDLGIYKELNNNGEYYEFPLKKDTNNEKRHVLYLSLSIDNIDKYKDDAVCLCFCFCKEKDGGFGSDKLWFHEGVLDKCWSINLSELIGGKNSI